LPEQRRQRSDAGNAGFVHATTGGLAHDYEAMGWSQSFLQCG
jgi:hypothetical protein